MQNLIQRYLLPGAAVVFLISGCAFVETSEQGAKVRVLTAQEVDRCKYLGKVTSNVSDHIGIIKRGEEKVAEDVLANAKNSAADMGGDTLVAVSKLSEGKQTFNV